MMIYQKKQRSRCLLNPISLYDIKIFDISPQRMFETSPCFRFRTINDVVIIITQQCNHLELSPSDDCIVYLYLDILTILIVLLFKQR